jgi:glycosyltransferase involved in cell wall biosynthesis
MKGKEFTKPLVSVITPVYNGEEFLTECIESVLTQTYAHWEYMIVNNCSSDGTQKIAETYAAKDRRIRVHNNSKFLTALQNHNHALRMLSPESQYCKILHADDLLFPECLERMVQLGEQHPTVGLVGSYMLHGNKVILDGLPYPGSVISGRELSRRILLGGPNVFGSPTTLLIRADIVRSKPHFFGSSKTYADHEACYDLLKDHDFGFVHQVLTFSRVHGKRRTALAKDFNTYIAARLNLAVKFGHVYLGTDEFKKRLEELLTGYYRFLGKSLFLLREKDFWKYHRDELRTAGYPFSTRKFVLSCCSGLLDIRPILNKLRRKG